MDTNFTDDNSETNLSNLGSLDSERQLRLSLYRIFYKRFEIFFAKRNVKITRDTPLKSILEPDSIVGDWEELNNIGLTMPMLKMPKFLNYIIAFYVAGVCILLLILVTKYFQLAVILLDLPIIGMLATLTAMPILYFVFMFKRQRLPCDTVDELVEFIISIHWAGLIKDDNRLIKQILQEESDSR